MALSSPSSCPSTPRTGRSPAQPDGVVSLATVCSTNSGADRVSSRASTPGKRALMAHTPRAMKTRQIVRSSIQTAMSMTSPPFPIQSPDGFRHARLDGHAVFRPLMSAAANDQDDADGDDEQRPQLGLGQAKEHRVV